MTYKFECLEYGKHAIDTHLSFSCKKYGLANKLRPPFPRIRTLPPLPIERHNSVIRLGANSRAYVRGVNKFLDLKMCTLKVSKYKMYVSISKILKKNQLKKNLSSLQNFIPFQNVLEALYNKCKEFYLLMRAKWVIPCFVVVF